MQQIFLALGQALRKGFLILSLMIFLLGLFSFVPPSYAGQGQQNRIAQRANEKIERKVNEKSRQLTTEIEGAKESRGADRPADVQEEQVKKGAVEEAKVLRDLFTGRKPDGSSVFDSK